MRKRAIATIVISAVVIALLATWAAAALSASARDRSTPHATGQRRYGTVKGMAELCVPKDPEAGSSAASCAVYTGNWSGCYGNDGHDCRSLDRAAIKTSAGKTVVSVPLKRGRFTAHVSPGDYRAELLFTARHKTPVVFRPTMRIEVRAGHTAKIVFKGYTG
jgi:hypothetical protein